MMPQVYLKNDVDDLRRNISGATRGSTHSSLVNPQWKPRVSGLLLQQFLGVRTRTGRGDHLVDSSFSAISAVGTSAPEVLSGQPPH
jgi:hypothetical protein